MSNRAVARLTRLLEAEKAALLAGDMEAVAVLAVEKEELAKGFNSANSDELRQLSAPLERNRVLLSAASQGVKTVLTALQAQRAARTSLSSYDSSGRAKQIAQPTRGTERHF